MNNNSLIYITIALICVWFILDNFYGDKKISRLVEDMVNG